MALLTLTETHKSLSRKRSTWCGLSIIRHCLQTSSVSSHRWDCPQLASSDTSCGTWFRQTGSLIRVLSDPVQHQLGYYCSCLRLISIGSDVWEVSERETFDDGGGGGHPDIKEMKIVDGLSDKWLHWLAWCWHCLLRSASVTKPHIVSVVLSFNKDPAVMAFKQYYIYVYKIACRC